MIVLYFCIRCNFIRLFITISFLFGFTYTKAQSIETLSNNEQKELSKIIFKKRLYQKPLFVFNSNLNGCFRCQSILAAIFQDTTILKNSIIIVNGLDTSQFENFRNNFSLPPDVSIIESSILSSFFDRTSKLHVNEIAALKYIGGNIVFYTDLKLSVNFQNLQNCNVLQTDSETFITISKSTLINGLYDFIKLDNIYYYITSPTQSLFEYKNNNRQIVVDSLTYLNNYSNFIEDIHDSLKKINTAQESIDLYYSYIKQLKISNYTYESLININDKVFAFGTFSYPLNTPAERIRICSQRFLSPIEPINKKYNFFKTFEENQLIIPSELYGYFYDSNLFVTPYLIGKQLSKVSQIPMAMKYRYDQNYWKPSLINEQNVNKSYFRAYEYRLKDLIMKKNFLSKEDFSFTYMPITKIDNVVYLNYCFEDTLFLQMGYTNYHSSYLDTNNKIILSIENYYGNIALIIKQVNKNELKIIKYYKLDVDITKNPIFKMCGRDILCAYYDKNIIKVKTFKVPLL